MTASHRGSRRRGTEPTSSGSRTPAAPQPTTPKGGNPRSRHEPRPTPMTADYKSHDNHDDSRTPDNARNCPSRVVFCLVTRFAAESGPSWLALAARRSRNPLKRGRFRGGIAAATCSHPSGHLSFVEGVLVLWSAASRFRSRKRSRAGVTHLLSASWPLWGCFALAGSAG
jgi:hypothetical protein